MVKVKTAQLSDAQLDWAVGKLLGFDVAISDREDDTPQERDCFFWSPVWSGPRRDYKVHCQGDVWGPSYEWADGGPIIERERISPLPLTIGGWGAYVVPDRPAFSGELHLGPTPLIAAMRAFVASKLGDEVEVPE